MSHNNKVTTVSQNNRNKLFQGMLFLLLLMGMGIVQKVNSGSPLSSNVSEQILNEDQQDVQGKFLASRELELKKVSKAKKIKSNKASEILFNDPSMKNKWGLKVMESNKAWQLTRGSRDIVVAVIDTGIDTKHKSLKNNLWVNKGEIGTDIHGADKRTNGKDDDGNGFVDDVHGWNFVGQNHELVDNHGHGTHIAGIIGAEGGKGKVAGVSPNVSLMILKYYDPKAVGLNNLKNTVYALRYAISQGANIINYSGGGLEPSKEEKEAIQLAKKKGILVVAAAGNERSNSDVHSYYPADYNLDNIISVTAVDKGKSKNGSGGNILSSSNFGKKTVDIAAPGNNIESTVPGGGTNVMTGTSQATAFVSGVAALVMANNRDLKAHQVIKILTQTGDLEPSLAGKTRYQRRINTYKALTIVGQGLGVSGVVAQNEVGFNSESFSIQKTKSRANRSISSGFGAALLKNIKN